MSELARIRAAPERLATVVRQMTITTGSDPFYGGLLLSVCPRGLENPACSRRNSPSVYATYAPSFFEDHSVESETLAVLKTAPTLRWLEWFEDDVVSVVFAGDTDADMATRAEIRGAEQRVRAEPLAADVSVEDVELGLPDTFDDDGTFAPAGRPAPTRVETTADALERLVEAATTVRGTGVPLVVRDGEFRLGVSGEFMEATGRLPAEVVEGPDCENWYGDEFGAVVRTLEGPVTLQIVPDGPVAVIQERPNATRRYVLEQQV